MDQRYPRGARRQWVLQEDQVQELQADFIFMHKCGALIRNANLLMKHK
jgi:hypothetical protein